MSNIDEDIKYVKECLKLVRVFFKAIKKETDYKEIDDVAFCIAIDNILEERKQDKKRIKELEVLEDDLKDKRIVYVDTPEFEEKFIPKQKIKDKIEEVKKEENLYARTNIIQVLEELLQGEDK